MEQEDLLILRSLIEQKIQEALVEKGAKFNFLDGIKLWEEEGKVFVTIPKKLYEFDGKVSKKHFSKSKIKEIIYTSLNEWKNIIECDTMNII